MQFCFIAFTIHLYAFLNNFICLRFHCSFFLQHLSCFYMNTWHSWSKPILHVYYQDIHLSKICWTLHSFFLFLATEKCPHSFTIYEFCRHICIYTSHYTWQWFYIWKYNSFDVALMCYIKELQKSVRRLHNTFDNQRYLCLIFFF